MTKMKGTEEMTNILDLADQALFLGERATGATSVIQCIWVYDRAIDIGGLRRFHHHLQRGRLARRIERSPLPFGRHRWVMGSDSSDFQIKISPTDFKVVIGSEEKQYTGFMAGADSTVGMAFIKIEDLGIARSSPSSLHRRTGQPSATMCTPSAG